ncbi:hypothetical protein PPTG_20853 [Phytophthora nicotianae INRA-310]|uniref:Uncharacterized protein n=1 Tax=Phytophthora nicotianae (strain INRA-310) TaxID=761204 RepID=W2RHU8_PHYN3|nr:hypothetical protein PPTG_20853 [Phytophthora nicotianae INRA-310]ETN24967.1 hypothetical protein PPTG_20853 [Phytophthora nicotianae INRA-310]
MASLALALAPLGQYSASPTGHTWVLHSGLRHKGRTNASAELMVRCRPHAKKYTKIHTSGKKEPKKYVIISLQRAGCTASGDGKPEARFSPRE